MARTVAVGVQDFSKIVEKDYFYIDKTNFIKEWWESGDEVTLITRPRRFGKTLNMSMVEQFFSVNYKNRGDLFENLAIWKQEKYRALQGTYPVISLSFASVKERNYQMMRKKICHLLTKLFYTQHAFLLESGFLCEADVRYVKRISAEMDDSDASMAICQLSEFLYRCYGKKAVILLDEYDTPMQEAYMNGYWDEASAFIRSLFHAALKTNMHMERALMTGITRIAKESIFSGLNHLKVVTSVSLKYAAAFGFTEQEVADSLKEYGMSAQMGEVRAWYDGFKFGQCDNMYNPWSIINYLDERRLGIYWANTSSNSLVGELLRKGSVKAKLLLEDLMNGKTIQVPMDEELVFSQLADDKGAVWSLLVAGGYLKIWQVTKNRKGNSEYVLGITNRETRTVFDRMATGWFEDSETDYNDFSEALLSGDTARMNAYMNQIALETFSCFDTGSRPSQFRQPENFYHGFVLGLIADLRNLYRITSNRESGIGRYDVMLEPVDKALDAGIIIEFKVQDTEREDTLLDTAGAAINQILAKKYPSMLEAAGMPMERIYIYGFAFSGKKVLVDGGCAADYAVKGRCLEHV
ncbi:MAG: AAA family ATPase [Eubacterium sp.]|nr:AAA family ATPase [Eubacterium sp.]